MKICAQISNESDWPKEIGEIEFSPGPIVTDVVLGVAPGRIVIEGVATAHQICVTPDKLQVI